MKSTVNQIQQALNNEQEKVNETPKDTLPPNTVKTETAPIRPTDPRIFTQVELMGKTFDMLLDNGAVSSWIGPGPAKLVD